MRACLQRRMTTPLRAFQHRFCMQVMALGLLSALSTACNDPPTVRARSPLSPPALEEASQRLNGRWTAHMQAGNRSSTWSIVFEGRSVAIHVDDQSKAPRGWIPTLVQDDTIILVVAHQEQLTESVLRFLTPDQFTLDALTKVVFTRAEVSEIHEEFRAP